MKPGDVVVLKSGGPKMTVRTLYGDKLVDVAWFDRQGLESASFHEEMLRLDKPAETLTVANYETLVGIEEPKGQIRSAADARGMTCSPDANS